MCGIVGYVGSSLAQSKLNQLIRIACDKIQHRGPDEQGYFVENNVALAIARLSIRDPAQGKQPLSYKEMTVVFNGELYDTDPLRAMLENKGYIFKTDCDTEIFLYAFIEYGSEILKKLFGMFAFAIWDNKLKRLYLGRDRWGEKPLYFSAQNDSIVFASELSALKIWPNISWDVSLEDIFLFLRHSYIPSRGTGWTHIFKLEPGTFITWENYKYKIQKYFIAKVNFPKKKADFFEETVRLYQFLEASVKNCMVSDRPLGVFLSGGIDSTTVSYFASKYNPKLITFSIDWKDTGYSEKHYIDQAVNFLKIKNFRVYCTSDFFQDHFEKLVQIYGEPFADESMFPCYCLAKFAKDYVDVVLTGDGADELFHGYERYSFLGAYKDYLDIFAATNDKTKNIIYSEEIRKHLSTREDLVYEHYLQSKNFFDSNRIKSWIDMHTYLPYDILTKMDRATMGVGLEARTPFLTPVLTDFALNCSTDFFIGEGIQGKKILKLAMKKHLPKSILERKKTGFGMPIEHWFRSCLKDWMVSRLMEGSLGKTGWFSKNGIENLIRYHLSGRQNLSRTILNLLVLETWLRINH